jgi:heme o synthase
VAPLIQMTNWYFAVLSLPLNLYFVYLAMHFRKHADAKSSRKLFRFSLIYLPILILLMFATKHPLQQQDQSPHLETFLKDKKRLDDIKKYVEDLRKSIKN